MVNPVSITHQFNGDAAAADLVDAAQLDTQLGNLATTVNAEIATRQKTIKDTGGLANQSVRFTALHPEIVTSLAGLFFLQDVTCATSSNITLSGLQTIDGYATLAADRVLVNGQTDATQNGIYAAASGAWTRTSDASGALTVSTTVAVLNGTSYAGSSWRVASAVTVGSGQLTWIQIQGFASTLPITRGGTGATTAAGARANLGLGSFALLNALPAGSVTQASLAPDVLYQVDTIAAVRALAPGAYNTVITRGNASLGDGRGGSWRWSASSTAIDDGITVLLPASAPANGRWLRYEGALVNGKPGFKYTLLAAVPRNNGNAVSSMTRSGATVTVNVVSTGLLQNGVFITIQGANETAYNGSWATFNVTPTSFQFTIGASPASPATGVILAYWWEMLEDANHSQTGFANVTTPDIHTLRLNYSATAAKIGQFTVAPDDALSPYGLVVGGDVGTAYTNILSFAPFEMSFNGGGLGAGMPAIVDISPLVTGDTTVTNGGTAIRRVSHGTVPAGDVPMVCVKHTSPAGSQPKMIRCTWTTTTVDVYAMSPISGYINYTGSVFQQTLSDNVAAVGLSYNSGTGVLRVTHEDTLDDLIPPMVSSFGGTYIVQVTNVTSSYFEVNFYDYAGSKVTGAANTNMQFSYSKVRSLTPSTFPDDMVVSVRRGLVPVRTDDFWRVAGNNLWVFGMMEAT